LKWRFLQTLPPHHTLTATPQLQDHKVTTVNNSNSVRPADPTEFLLRRRELARIRCRSSSRGSLKRRKGIAPHSLHSLEIFETFFHRVEFNRITIITTTTIIIIDATHELLSETSKQQREVRFSTCLYLSLVQTSST
jgi:hypothetical protein